MRKVYARARWLVIDHNSQHQIMEIPIATKIIQSLYLELTFPSKKQKIVLSSHLLPFLLSYLLYILGLSKPQEASGVFTVSIRHFSQ